MAERKYKIHPAIGSARVGNADRSDNDNSFYFIGPEYPDVPANFNLATKQFEAFKKDGKIKPQAARFRIFEYEKKQDGKYQISEVRTDDKARAVKINWKVTLANRKAFFCTFQGQAGALDAPLFSKSYSTKPNADPSKSPFPVRNASVKGAAKRESELCLKPGEKTIAGGDTGTVVHFTIDKPDNVKNFITTLGELRSDPEGCLKVIGGLGTSGFAGSATNSNGLLTGFANNDGWFDDVSDGPVDATLTIDGKEMVVEGAWVIVGPPDFAPPVRSYRTMYDSLVDTVVREMEIPADDGLFVESGPLHYIAKMQQDWKANKDIRTFKPKFTRDIAPILEALVKIWRVHEYQFVDDGEPPKRTRGGPIAVYHETMALLEFNKLGGQGSLDASRAAVFERLRDPNTFDKPKQNKLVQKMMPSAYGDYFQAVNNRPESDDPEYLHSVSKLQFALLRAWAEGNGKFEEDWGQVQKSLPNITAEGLDRAALENMSGGAFYPGMEAGWLLTKKEMFSSPFRIRRKPEPGKRLGLIPIPGESNPAELKFEAGLFTQQMALPWQADFRDCEADFERDASLGESQQRRIAWWPTNRPDDVFPVSTPKDRKAWARKWNGNVDEPFYSRPGGDNEKPDEIDRHYKEMVKHWSTLGFIVETKPNDHPQSDLFEVEFNPPPAGQQGPPATPLVASTEAKTTEDKV